MFVDEMAVPGAYDKFKEIQRLCQGKNKMVQTPAVAVIKTARIVVETKRDKATLADRVNDLKRKLEDVRSVERLTNVNLEVASPCINATEA